MVSPAVTASSPSRIGAIGMPAGWPAEAGWPVAARSEGRALAVAAVDGAGCVVAAGEVRRKRGGHRRRWLRCTGRGGRRWVRRGLDVDHQAGRSAELEHAEAGSRFETDPITDHAFEVADVRDFPDFGKAGLEVTREAADDIAVLKHSPDARRAFQGDRLTAGVANKRRAGLPGELILRHGI